jgi:hypothetical protein
MILAVLVLFILFSAVVMRAAAMRQMHRWLPFWIWSRMTKRNRIESCEPTHILFCVVDHFEPGNGGVNEARQRRRLAAWVKGYSAMAAQYRDADGRMPQHTWFYPPHHRHEFLEDLVHLCRKGCGDIEMHLHHNRMPPFPDTAETLRNKIRRCIDDYARFGIFCQADGSRRFAFIHGDWSLDNARGVDFCGVNNELTILKECGCYADFTFPTMTSAQPTMANRIYYASDDPARPKSYDKGCELSVGGSPQDELVLIPGIIGLRWKPGKIMSRPSIEASELNYDTAPSPARIDYWVRDAVTVQGQPEWKFIKLHTHGAPEKAHDVLFGKSARRMHDYLARTYNDGRRYVLHYVTAREMYNLARAAEAGMKGNPDRYRDFSIGRYRYLSPAAARQEVLH